MTSYGKHHLFLLNTTFPQLNNKVWRGVGAWQERPAYMRSANRTRISAFDDYLGFLLSLTQIFFLQPGLQRAITSNAASIADTKKNLCSCSNRLKKSLLPFSQVVIVGGWRVVAPESGSWASSIYSPEGKIPLSEELYVQVFSASHASFWWDTEKAPSSGPLVMAEASMIR